MFRNVENKKGIHAEFVGEKQLKNVKHAIKIFSIIQEQQAFETNSVQTSHTKPKLDKSIAVLPFVNISSDAEQEYFSDGLTEEVIADLSMLNNLLVISRSSVMTFKGTAKNLKTIADELNVRYVLEGSVRKAGNHVRITAQLIDAKHDVHLWAEKYHGSINDIFEIQENVSRSIVSALSIRLNQAEANNLAKRPINNIQAYELYKKAQYEIFQFKDDSLKRAVQYLKKALEIEHDNPFLYSKLGSALLSLVNGMSWLDRGILKRVQELADKVFELVPDSPMGHVLIGYLTFYQGNMRDAIRQIQSAFDANPHDYDNLWLLILGYSYLGKSELAEKYADLMGEVDPYNPVYNALRSVMYYLKGDLDQAYDEINTAYETYPEVPQVQLYYAYFSIYFGNKMQAREVLNRYMANTQGTIFSVMGELFVAAINNDDPDELLTLKQEEKLKIDVEWTWLVADFYSMMNRTEQALSWLKHAVDKGFINYPLLAFHDPFLENIRKEPQFLELMDRVKKLYQE